MTRRLKASMVAALATAWLGAGCSNSNSTTTPTQTAAAPTVTEAFNGTLPIGGNKFYSFKVSVFGTVNISLINVGGAGVPPTVTLGLGVGTPAGTTCSTTSTVNATTSDTLPQLTTTLDVGVYCADVYDLGNLTAPASFNITIAHP
jgi:hypothetical protein